jgi:hypothetical protein
MAEIFVGGLLVEVVRSADGPRLRVQGRPYGVETTPLTREDLGHLIAYLGRETDTLKED